MKLTTKLIKKISFSISMLALVIFLLTLAFDFFIQDRNLLKILQPKILLITPMLPLLLFLFKKNQEQLVVITEKHHHTSAIFVYFGLLIPAFFSLVTSLIIGKNSQLILPFFVASLLAFILFFLISIALFRKYKKIIVFYCKIYLKNRKTF